MRCGGTGKCITCEGAGSRGRVRRSIKPPVTTPSAGFEVCSGCFGKRFCYWCDGSGVQDSGGPCDCCYMCGGVCEMCEGNGQVRPDTETVAPVDRTYRGELRPPAPRWSQQLDVGEPWSISAGSPRTIVVRGSTATVAYDARGEQKWRLAGEFAAVRALPDGRTVVRSPTEVRIVDALGQVLTAWSAIGRLAPRPFRGDRWIDVEGTGQSPAELVCRAASGAEQWRVPLDCREGFGANVTGSQIVVSDSTGLRLYDEQGRAQHQAVIARASSGPVPFAAAEGSVLELTDGYLAPFRNGLQGSSWYRWRPAQGEVAPFGPGTAFMGPATVSDRLFVAASLDTTDEGLQFIRAFSESNARLWELALSRAVAIVRTFRGGVAVVSSPTVERFENYRALHPVEDYCRVTLVDASGAVRRAVVVREPIVPTAAFAGDAVYVALYSGKLLAIDAS